tara:strand:+ start:1183 stop:1350 length:168 start_codon:yes stop_codon:yes gene_type:complete
MVPWFNNYKFSYYGFGIPAWALYSISGTFIYALIIYYLINNYWDIYKRSEKNKCK